ncbi:DUF6702 family protein [Brevifollis gellanilyticus]|uniref:Uncharacterized protein n=1 Tax=Brevifollis gellanilyticus TaxID=748831 RepID=A0A512M4R0_9BACT|nr:DUF6702 family protein [Brevifollis gellanilyticus]GEP41713.1 hypothetical protein BGE01nite_10040 [Brevifollis gellanilyticus]
MSLQRVILILTLACASWAQAHSLHQSTAEAEYNSVTQKLEVSLTVFINDLELALMRHSEKLLSFEKTPADQFDAVILDYLTNCLVLTNDAGKRATITWLGREKDEESAKSNDPAVTLYFEMSVPGDLKSWTLRHAVFGNIFKDQVNLMHLKMAGRDVQMSFKAEDGTKRLGM